MKIDCRQCEMYRSEHCEDCLVTHLLHPMGAPVEVDADVNPSLQNLATAGLVPVLRFRKRAQPPPSEQAAS